MNIKLVEVKDIEQVMEIIKDAKILLSKNSSQWQDEYPTREIMLSDIKNHYLHGVYKDDLLVAIASFIVGIDENYHVIDEGHFVYPTSKDDLVIHRIAVRDSFHHLKLVDALFNYALSYARVRALKTIKADTSLVNVPMQKVLERNDFIKRGIIYIHDDLVDPKRLAYELVL